MDAFDEWSLEEAYDEVDDLAAAADLERALPLVLAPSLRDADAEAVDELFAGVSASLSPHETESLGSALRQIGRWAAKSPELRQLAGTALPAAGTAAGTVIGGPIGAAVGTSLGQRAAGALGSAPTSGASGRAQPPAQGPPGGARPGVPAAPAVAGLGVATPSPSGATPPAPGSDAAAKLLYLVRNPAFIWSLVSATLQGQGRPSLPVGGAEVPVGAFMNAVSEFAAEVAEQADARIGDLDAEDVFDGYLRTGDGCLACDPAVARQRAEALIATLQRAGDDGAEFFTGPGEGAEGEDWGDEEWDDESDGAWDEDWTDAWDLESVGDDW